MQSSYPQFVCAHPTTHKQASGGQQTSARRQGALLGVCGIFQDQALQPRAFKMLNCDAPPPEGTLRVSGVF